MKRHCFCQFFDHISIKKYENVGKHNAFDHILIKKLENTILFQFFWTHFNEKIWKHIVFPTFFYKMFGNTMILIQKCNFQTLAPEVDKMSSRRFDLRYSGLGSRSRQNELQKARFEHFQASVDRMPQITILHDAIGCQQKQNACDICVDRMPANSDSFNTWGDRMPAKTWCFWYLCRWDARK